MRVRGADLAIGLVAAGTAAAVGYVVTEEYRRRSTMAANIGARVVEPTEIPPTATVVDRSSRRLRELPGVSRAIDRAIEREQWVNVTLERSDAWAIVDGIRDSLPYHRATGDEELSGLFVREGDRLVVLDAFGWDLLKRSRP